VVVDDTLGCDDDDVVSVFSVAAAIDSSLDVVVVDDDERYLFVEGIRGTVTGQPIGIVALILVLQVSMV
jgi:hypothetical protein